MSKNENRRMGEVRGKIWSSQVIPWWKFLFSFTDIDARRFGDQTGLETLVVLTLNDDYLKLTLNNPPGEYSCKIQS